MRTQLQPAYCIHSRPYRESSQIMQLLTLEYGLISCVSRGSRKKCTTVECLFTPLLISWSGKGDLFTLTHIEVEGVKLINTPDIAIIAMYLNELILKLVPKLSPSPEIFDLYKNVISLLSQEVHQEKLLRWFEIEILSLVGHGVVLDKEMDHETPISKNNLYRYDVGLGASKVTNERNTWNIVKGSTLLALQSPLDMQDKYLSEAKRLMRGIINWHLGDRSLHSREILQFMQT